MDRFTSLEIDNPRHPILTTVFANEDSFIDQGLRLYDIKQALHLYLKSHGYRTIVFYNTADGFSSFEEGMLRLYLSEVSSEEQNGSIPVQSIQVNAEQVGRRSGSHLGQRMKKKIPGASLIPDNQPISVNKPELNLYFDEVTQRWHRTSTGDRIANMDQILYNLPRRRHLAIVVDASDNEAEFTVGRDKLDVVIKETQRKALLDSDNINDNRLIILVNAESCNQQLMSLFFDNNNHPVPHPSIFMNGFFRTQLLSKPKGSDYYTLDFRNAFPLSQPTKEDVKRILLRARNDSDVNKGVDWIDLDDICEQLSFQEKWTLNDLYLELMQKKDYTYESFKPENVQKRGNAEQELEMMIGLEGVKEQIRDLKNRMVLAIQKGEDISKMNKHVMFFGNPGTGKTTVARIIARIYKDLGFVKKGHLVEVNRENLVAGYVGQTAIKTQKVIDSAMDGVLFIDEAYRLARGGENDFGQEAIDTILARMENDRDRLIVIMAGYESDMQELFSMNQGLESRFNEYIRFEDYTVDELKQIFIFNARKKYTITPEVDSLLSRLISYAVEYKTRTTDKNYSFGNGRWVRNLMEKVEKNVAKRNGKKDSDIGVLLPEDFANLEMKELRGFELNDEPSRK